MALSHRQAEDMIQAALDDMLSREHRLELKRHLADCRQCRDYVENLVQLEGNLSRSLKSRWPEPNLSDYRMANVAVVARTSAEGRHRRGCLFHWIQPAAGAGAMVLLILIMAGVLGQLAARQDSETGSGAPLPPGETATSTASFVRSTLTLPTEAVDATMTPSASAVLCQITAQAEEGYVPLYSQPGISGDTIGKLTNGEIAIIVSLYGGDNYSTWLQISFSSSTGWIRWSDETMTLSDVSCTIPIITATLSPYTVTPLPRAAIPTPTPISPSSPN